MRADADRLVSLEREWSLVASEELRAQREYAAVMQSETAEDDALRSALFRLWQAQQRQRELAAELDAFRH